MNNWNYEKLSKLCFRIGDGLHGTPSYVEGSGIYFINGNNLKNGRIEITNNTKCVSEEELKNNFIELNENSLLLSINGTLGSMAFYRNEKVMLGKSSAYLNFTSPINKFYYYYFQLPFVQEYFFNVATGSTIKNLSLKSIQDFEVPVPEFNVWNNIGNVLSSLDSKIELNNRINAELEAMAKTLYDYWFVQFDFPNAIGKPYKTSGGTMIWSEELKREIPEGWEVKDLGEIINIFDSKRIPLSRGEREKKVGNIPYYGATSVMGYVDEYIFDDDYVLIAEDGSVMDEKGFPIVQFIWGKTWVNNHAHVIQAKNVINNEYIFYLVKTISVIQIMSGSIQLKINQENLKRVKVCVPDENTLKKFASFAIPVRKQLINAIEENQKLTELRDWLLPMLMNGQVKVN